MLFATSLRRWLVLVKNMISLLDHLFVNNSGNSMLSCTLQFDLLANHLPIAGFIKLKQPIAGFIKLKQPITGFIKFKQFFVSRKSLNPKFQLLSLIWACSHRKSLTRNAGVALWSVMSRMQLCLKNSQKYFKVSFLIHQQLKLRKIAKSTHSSSHGWHMNYPIW